MNNGILLEDPMKTKTICLNDLLLPSILCVYQYYPCDNFMGYALRIRFENYGNAQSRYAGGNDYYEIGKCSIPDAG